MSPATSPDGTHRLAHLPSAGAIDAIAEARHGDPFAVLGPHDAGEGVVDPRVPAGGR